MLLNEGKSDRLLRTVGGAALLALVFVPPHTPIGWVGLVPLITGLVGFCPIYRALGIRTNST